MSVTRRAFLGGIAAAGLEPRIDPVGNIFGRRAGTTHRRDAANGANGLLHAALQLDAVQALP